MYISKSHNRSEISLFVNNDAVRLCEMSTRDKQKHRGAILSDGKDNKSISHHFGVAQIKRRNLKKVMVGHKQEDIDHRRIAYE
ncbi:uncharacterized protein LOC128243531 isoform X3 [Mya arenaria]|uniref:uncharacterized protein LOC128243531 isoform X3 n=1 Tax=Mya arenaria TaxID=6604 RepID=UPI0022E33612|nr:uncharacterized protein LOC128243531 isoform X3 [Mya arenaria]